MHRNIMRLFRLYMLVGGMPQAIETYLEQNNLFYYTMESETSHHLLEIDFLISSGDKICPLEIKSGNYKSHKSLDTFCNKFSNRVKDKYVVHAKDYKWESGIHYIPVYMIPFL